MTPTSPLIPLDTIHTADEAAARLRITRRMVITLGQRYGCCSVHGRIVLFSEQDLLDLWQMLRATPREQPRPVAVKAELPGAAGIWIREYVRKQQAVREERKKLRREREAAAREQRLEEKRKASRAKAEERAAKRLEKAEAKAQAKAEANAIEVPLDRKNRDPNYWTPERKEQLRADRRARLVAHNEGDPDAP